MVSQVVYSVTVMKLFRWEHKPVLSLTEDHHARHKAGVFCFQHPCLPPAICKAWGTSTPILYTRKLKFRKYK